MFAYYSYFGRARAGIIAAIDTDIHALGDLDAQLAADEQRLDSLQSATTEELAQLETARAQRDAALVAIKAESRDSAQVLQRLQGQQAALATLLLDLKRAIQPFPSDAAGAFGALRGRLAWPVGGHLAAHFGQVRVGGVKWDGMLIDTERGADVRAVYRGPSHLRRLAAWARSAHHCRSRRRLPEPLRSQRSAVQGGRRHRVCR